MGIGISNSIRSTSNNDSRNNGNSSSIVTGHGGGSSGGEREKQFQEDHRENITFLELCCRHLLCAHIWVPALRECSGWSWACGTHQSAFGLDQRSVLAVHLVVQAAGVAQVVAGAVPSPQRGGGGTAVHTFTALCI